MHLEDKLTLIHHMRQHEQRNYARMGGCADRYASSISSTLRLRFLIALFLFLTFFYLDIRQLTFGEVNSHQLQEYISTTIPLFYPE